MGRISSGSSIQSATAEAERISLSSPAISQKKVRCSGGTIPRFRSGFTGTGATQALRVRSASHGMGA